MDLPPPLARLPAAPPGAATAPSVPAGPAPGPGSRPPDGLRAGLACLPEAERQAVLSRETALQERFARFGPRARRRLVHFVAGSMIFVPLVTWFVTPLGLAGLWFQLPLAAAFGAVVALARPGRVACGFLLAATGGATLLIGEMASIGYGTLMSLIFYFIAGLAVGIVEDLKRIDGE